MSCAGLATGIGGAGVLLVRRPSAKLLDTLLGFTGGIMLAALCFSLLVPAFELGAIWQVALGFAVGGAFIAAADRFLPHVHARFAERGGRGRLGIAVPHQALLLLIAMTIHNFPEGMAVGTAFAAGRDDIGLTVAIAIGVQNIPEGFAVAAPLAAAGMSPGRAALVGLASGAVEPIAAFGAYGALDVASGILPLALAFAAAAMLYVVVDELIPESQARGNERASSLALLVGFALMMVLDTALG